MSACPAHSEVSSAGWQRSSSSPMPSCPFTPRPHAYTAPSAVAASVWRHPDASNVTLGAAELAPAAALPSLAAAAAEVVVAGGMDTTVGLHRSLVSPNPSCPNLFQPQPYSTPSLSTATVCRHPPATLTTTRPRSASTSVGVSRSVMSPCPSCPYLLHPKLYSSPASVTTTLCRHPQLTRAATAPSSPHTRVGSSLSSLWPSPRLPYLPQPHAYTWPVEVDATECSAPHAMLATRCPLSAPTSCGVSWSSECPSPSWPAWLRPNAYSSPDSVSTRVWVSPHATSATGMPAKNEMGRGTNTSPRSPCPSRPKSAQPQDQTCLLLLL
mmetsp:Transcript_29924/g.76219  ORF Transcript_29924/g.76219 Transcript_29924/m.76219 type:complete len:325 (-) Transcript_29924:396-1370(-)